VKWWEIPLVLLLGVGIGGFLFTPHHIWDYESDALQKLDSQMSGDKSERIAMVVVTQNGVYNLSQFDRNLYTLAVRIVEK
jgi:hypothetical protein